MKSSALAGTSRLLLALSFIVVFRFSVEAQPTVGVIHHDESASWEGYTLFSPFPSDTTFLIDNWGRVINKWVTGGAPLKHAYLLPDGSLLKAQNPGGQYAIDAPGRHGAIRKFSWDGALLWDFKYVTDTYRAHHDIEPMPNGNVLMIAWEAKGEADLVAAGVDTSGVTNNVLWPDHIIEVQQTGPTTGTIVWEWHMWDHLVQDFDPLKANFGVVSANPQLINANELLGGQEDWAHINGVDYNPILDQIVLSTPRFNELWFIDHSTTTVEAAGSTGGNRGMGGDLLYRWGNPRIYGRGVSADQKMYFQHDGRWIPAGYPGAGNILVFNNRNPAGPVGPDGDYSSVGEFVPAMNPDGSYTIPADPTPFGPTGYLWTYQADPVTDFYAPSVSGAQRLPNGNTLVCDGPAGAMFEVTPAGLEVWRYVNPLTRDGRVDQGAPLTSSGPYFKCDRYGPEYGAFAGRDMTPGYPIELGTARHVNRLTPADGSEQLGPTPTFSWTAGQYAAEYRLQIAHAPTFGPLLSKTSATIIDETGILSTSYTPSSPLPGGTLYWRVQSSNEFGPGGWSDTGVFSTTELPVELVSFRARVNGESDVALYWETASEKDNAGFAIELRSHGMEQRGVEDWTKVGFVEGSGTSAQTHEYSYLVDNLEPGTWHFRLKQIDLDGSFQAFGPVSVELEVPSRLWLASPYPNPFNPTARVRFAVGAAGHASLSVFDILGRRVKTLYEGSVERGQTVEAVLDAGGLTSGSYLIRLEANGEVASQTALVSK